MTKINELEENPKNVTTIRKLCDTCQDTSKELAGRHAEGKKEPWRKEEDAKCASQEEAMAHTFALNLHRVPSNSPSIAISKKLVSS